MNLEALPKYYSPKSPKLSDDAPATGTGCLTITDVMAAQGMVQSKAPLGLALFLAKVGVQDPQFAIEGLLNYAMALDNPTLNKLSEEIRLQIIPYLVSFAFADYSRSAASKARCEHCSGTGFYNVLREVVKHYRRGESVIKEEWVKELCQHCHGKGEPAPAVRMNQPFGLFCSAWRVLEPFRLECVRIPPVRAGKNGRIIRIVIFCVACHRFSPVARCYSAGVQPRARL